jgi:presequence protease
MKKKPSAHTIPAGILNRYKLIRKKYVGESNAICYQFEHIKSGARVFKIDAKDPNKTFCIAFKTFPGSDNGAPHILEHSVLNGSRSFPVKSPFDVLNKGSLSTFMNAFTSKDFTMFPVASMNYKDYFNLMHVYLDAVFDPLLLTDDRVLKQEGWHYELLAKNKPVVLNGVVYNEMKGVFSSPIRDLTYQVYKHLFPRHCYGYESGGHPASIPTLTQESFIRYYKRFYHPENSYIFLYGDADLSEELDFIDKNYLSRFGKKKRNEDIPEQRPSGSMKKIKGHYAVLEGAPVGEQTYLSLNFFAGQGTDRKLTMMLDLLCEVLFNQESAPVRLALQEASVGKDVSAVADNLKQNVIRIIVQNANAGEEEKFLRIVNETLKKVKKNGVDRMEMKGVLNRMEFQLREGNDAQKGLTAVFQSQPGFFFANDPFNGLEYEKPLSELKKIISGKTTEQYLAKYFLNNRHALLFTMPPKPGLEKERNDMLTKKLDAFKRSQSPEELDALVKETRELIRYQKREDSPAALATIPMLDLKDINPQSAWYPLEEGMTEGIPVLSYDQFTNKVVYINFYFDMKALPETMIPYAALLSNLLGLMGTKKYDYGKLNQQLNIYTGGFFTSPNSFLKSNDDSQLIPKFHVATKSLNNRVDKLFGLTEEILNHTDFTDRERMKVLLSRHKSQIEMSIRERGNKFTSIRLSSYFNNQGMFNELSGGLSYYWFVSDLEKNFDDRADTIAAHLSRVASLLFTRDNMLCSVTCPEKEMNVLNGKLAAFLGTIPKGKDRVHRWKFDLKTKNEGIRTSSKVQYISAGYNFKKLGYKWEGKMRVLDHILTTDWLQKMIRVVGGAYGGYCSLSPGGMITLNSYRDPNLKKTLETYGKTAEWLAGFDADDKSMLRYIIGTIASIDHPLTNSQKLDMAVGMYFSGRTKDDLQRDRDSILSSKPADIRGFAGMVRDVLKQDAFCVYGDAGKINSEKKMFGDLIQIER